MGKVAPNKAIKVKKSVELLPSYLCCVGIRKAQSEVFLTQGSAMDGHATLQTSLCGLQPLADEGVLLIKGGEDKGGYQQNSLHLQGQVFWVTYQHTREGKQYEIIQINFQQHQQQPHTQRASTCKPMSCKATQAMLLPEGAGVRP